MAQQITIKGTAVTAANEVLVADSNSKFPAVDGSLVTAMSGTNVGTGTVATARLDTGTTANKIVILDGTAKAPAVDGSLLTGIVSYTKSASDPTITTNPSGGVGTEWVNHTSGKQYICTDATTNANVWKCTGSHSGDIPDIWALGGNAYTLGGTSYGFSLGGLKHTPTNDYSDRIDRYAFASSSNSTDFGNLIRRNLGIGGSQSATHGYGFGGAQGGQYNPPALGATTDIQKFAFASAGNAANVADIARGAVRYHRTVHNASYCFSMAGDPGPAASGYVDDSIDKYSFAAEVDATDWANLTMLKNQGVDVSGGTHGYYVGGSTGVQPYSGPSYATTNDIQYFPYASQTNAIDSGDLIANRQGGCGMSGPDYGYYAGGNKAGSASATVEKFSLTVIGANSTNVGDLTNGAGTPSGALEQWSPASSSSSTTHGYRVGGAGGIPMATVIDRISFASDANATDVGDMTTEGGGGRTAGGGCWD